MSSELFLHRSLAWTSLALVLGISAPSARANVYATNIKLNGSAVDLVTSPGTAVTISYILNEPANSGVTIEVLSGTNTLRRLSFGTYAPGTLRGLNTVTWDGLDANSQPLPAGAYSVRVTAETGGYSAWTQISDDNDPLSYLWYGNGIAVNQNPRSRYYGRILIANSSPSGNASGNPGDVVGIVKLNADGSAADDGAFSDGGLDWVGQGAVPWKVSISEDDDVYVSDAAHGGAVYRWDPMVSPGGRVAVVRADNVTNGVLRGLHVSNASTNARIWMVSSNASSVSQAVLRWLAGTNGACASNDLGMTIVGLGAGGGLSGYPADVALDPSGNLYVCQAVKSFGDASPRVFRFPAYDPATNGGVAEWKPAWSVGAGDNECGQASDIAVDPTGTYVAVSFLGLPTSQGVTNGNTRILYATNGALAVNLDLGVMIGDFDTHMDTACAWDAVGNVYYIDNWVGRWRAVSPPGANQASTVAPALLRIESAAPPQITGITLSNQTVWIEFEGLPSDSTGAFTLVTALTVQDAFTPAAGASITSLGGGRFRASVPVNGPQQFYRVRR